MKLLSIAVPCYNSAAYMEKCVDSLLVGGDDVEIIIVDDGSQKDNTGEIADALAAKYEGIVKAVHQENGGHGEAVNTGLKNATGLYFKVVDSDDKLEPDAYKKVLGTLKRFKDDPIDMLISNYVYDKEGAEHKHVMQYRSVLPKDRVFTWEDAKHFKKGQYILMHSVIYRTQMVKDSGLKLPAHTFYVDSIYVFEPMPYVKKMYYLDVDFYLYYIGREDQSVNEKVMIGRLDQQTRVNNIMFDYFSKIGPTIKDRKTLYNYMYNYLEIITTITNVMEILKNTKESIEDKDRLWESFKERDEALYKKLRHGLVGTALNIPGRFGRAVTVFGYRVCQKIFKFN
ncbi:MAG: glycosyltransferase [Lachnospiraceae bacterium]|nr:glycosyltransferase [Lachnospiraceae bacterium]